MQLSTFFLSFSTSLMANAAIVQIFSDNACQNFIAERNVFDESCAPTGGFQSFKVTQAGGSNQQITAYSKNACVLPLTACTTANGNAECISATDNNGGSNALSSASSCGVS